MVYVEGSFTLSLVPTQPVTDWEGFCYAPVKVKNNRASVFVPCSRD